MGNYATVCPVLEENFAGYVVYVHDENDNLVDRRPFRNEHDADEFMYEVNNR